MTVLEVVLVKKSKKGKEMSKVVEFKKKMQTHSEWQFSTNISLIVKQKKVIAVAFGGI